MKRILFHLIASGLSWGIFFFGFLGAQERIAGRDAQSYDRIKLSAGFVTKPKVNASLYRFLWLHWINHTPGLAEVTYYGIDSGDTYYYFVEKDFWGRWSVTAYSQHYQVPSDEEHSLGHLGPAYIVERFSRNADGTIGAPIDPKADANDNDFALRFFDRDYNSLAFPDMY